MTHKGLLCVKVRALFCRAQGRLGFSQSWIHHLFLTYAENRKRKLVEVRASQPGSGTVHINIFTCVSSDHNHWQLLARLSGTVNYSTLAELTDFPIGQICMLILKAYSITLACFGGLLLSRQSISSGTRELDNICSYHNVANFSEAFGQPRHAVNIHIYQSNFVHPHYF